MSVLIKGMAMPPCCGLCIFEDYGYCMIAERYFGGNAKHEVASFCPLIELPEHHGGLIDANVLATESLKDGAYGYVSTKQIYDAETIVEAE